ncbi:MAG: DUF89 domain-containing protein [Candidatus Hodarchaeota archaeon]
MVFVVNPGRRCHICLVRQAFELAELATKDISLRYEAIKKALAYVLDQLDEGDSLPAMGTNVHRIVKRVTGHDDPYKHIKKEMNEAVLTFEKEVASDIDSSKNPLLTAIRYAIAGNKIDVGPGRKFDIKDVVRSIAYEGLCIDDSQELLERVKRGGRILYLTDNAGEIVFDKLLMKELKRFNVDIIAAVRGGAIVNDATYDDAVQVGLTEIIRVTTTGTDAVGPLRSEISASFQELLNSADFLISKGQGNFEALAGDSAYDRFFLLRVKCKVIADALNVQVGCNVVKMMLRGESI